MERPQQVGEVSEESVWGVVAARRLPLMTKQEVAQCIVATI